MELQNAGRESRAAKKSRDRRFINEAFRNKARCARAVLLSSRVERTARRPRRYRTNLPNGSARVPLRKEGVFEEHERDVGTRYIRCSLACPLALSRPSLYSILPLALFFDCERFCKFLSIHNSQSLLCIFYQVLKICNKNIYGIITLTILKIWGIRIFRNLLNKTHFRLSSDSVPEWKYIL